MAKNHREDIYLNDTQQINQRVWCAAYTYIKAREFTEFLSRYCTYTEMRVM